MACYCLCAVNHPEEPGICTGDGDDTVRFSEFPEDSALASLKSVDVRMCTPCREKTIARRNAEV